MRAEPKRGGGGPASGPFSVLGEGVTVTGNIAAQGDLHIEGRVEGDVKCAVLVLGESGHIEGAITAGEARIAGSVSGSISADELTIENSARTSGDISYTRIDMKAGAQTDGRLSHKGTASELKLVAEAKRASAPAPKVAE
ncbi:polymer-forming cytoskeletal protein [Pacificimonas sp. WHA3]|uniref:Polymer-forming cytoskeletal protein n=1 Tax=Pacificimonas pallii TaxID=2827236 RepID=A0ABS6SHY5_9SPHN|nr:polymer-forming cytoskeletal protein [Pacificimonas pallii]MBV7257865.1 polymer-forming cytoskeletal protein [Pacificimonas pallii]